MLSRCLFVLCCLSLVLGSFTVFAGETEDKAEPETELRIIKEQIGQYQRTVENTQKKVKTVNVEIARLKKKTVALSAIIQEYEASLNALEKELSGLKEQELKQQQNLAQRREQMSVLISGLEILARKPSESIIAAPMDPKDMAKSAVLMREAIPILQKSAQTLQKELKKLMAVQREIKVKQEQIQTVYKGMAEKQQQQKDLLIKKKQEEAKLLNQQAKTKRRISELTKKAQNIENIIRQNSYQKVPETPTYQEDKEYVAAAGNFIKAKGMLPMPVTGTIITKFNEKAKNGTTSQGITIKTRPGAQVISPYDGEVIFANYLKGYGKTLIIEHPGSYFTVLTGFAELTAREGETLLAGEPVGTMDEKNAGELYLELRAGDKPINPLLWLAHKN